MTDKNLVCCEVVKSADFTLPYPGYFSIYNDLPVLEGPTALFACILLKRARVRDRAVGNA